MKQTLLFFSWLLILQACNTPKYDLVIRNGMIYDGSGSAPFKGDIAINADTIAAIGVIPEKGKTELDAQNQAISPGFINMLSWATETLILDGKSMSDIKQGVTLEVMGEGISMGPLTDSMIPEMQSQQGDYKYEIKWKTLGEYLTYLEKKGVSCNIASFVGAATVRMNLLNFQKRKASPEELEKMKVLVKQAMEEGAMGVGTALIYNPGMYADTEELIELCKVAAPYGGMYITHMRSEGNKLHEAIDEVIKIAKEANIPAEIYHLKVSGKDNWGKVDSALAQIENARKNGLTITANMYTYPAGATGLDAAMPPFVQEGGLQNWRKRLQDNKIRKKVADAMLKKDVSWENLYLSAGTPEKILLIGFRQDSLKKYTGKTLAEVARLKGKSPEETAMDLVVQDDSRVGVVYFLMNEENIKKQLKYPWVSLGSDEESCSEDSVFVQSNHHPRAFGNFARFLGKYVRDEKIMTLEEGIRRMTSLPAANLKLKKRGKLSVGYFADMVVFDPSKIEDHATFEKPHQYATGVTHVFVNGTQVLKDGNHTGAMPGKFVKGPGFGMKK